MMQTGLNYEGRTVVVTGATGALGSAVAELLTAAGANCLLPLRTPVEEAPDHLAGLDRVSFVGQVDLTREEEVDRCYRSADRLWASIHCVGGFSMASLEETSLPALEQQWRINLVSCFLCCRAAVRAMKAAKAGGRIVNVAARPGVEPRTGAGMVAYTAAKAAVAALTEALAEEVASDGIWVNAVAPSIFDTSANRRAMPKADHDRWPKVSEVAASIAYLASPENRAARGAVIPVYGKS